MTIIPHDIIIDILCRLPTESLALFRCVSKEWLSLLTDPLFIRTHQKTFNRNRFIFKSDDDGSLYSVPYNNHHEEAVSTLTKLDFGFYRINCILGSFHGLVLASAYKRDIYAALLVLNPTTKDYVELPTSNQKQFFGMKGIGYDSVSHDYKVVVISSFDKYCGNVYVFNLRTNTWKQATYSPYHYNKKSGMSADEKLSELPLPTLYNEVDIVSDSDTKLVALGEKLAIFHELKGVLLVLVRKASSHRNSAETNRNRQIKWKISV
ncbi:F-box associated domain containing protein [Tanacetum coccineum]